MQPDFGASDNEGVSESRFYMWRAVFAVAHADNFIAVEEQDMLYNFLDDLPLSKEQLNILREDVATRQDTEEMFTRVTEAEDIEEFFEIAHALVWSDGEFSEQERAIMTELEQLASSRGYNIDFGGEEQTGLLRDLHAAFENGGMKAVLGKMVSGENK